MPTTTIFVTKFSMCPPLDLRLLLVSAYTAGKIYNSHKKLMLETDLQTTTVSRTYLSGTKIYLINKQTNAVY